MVETPPTTLSVSEAEAAGHADSAYLVVIEGTSSVPLPANGIILIGRAPECAIRIKDPVCSRRHVELRIEAGAVSLTDLDSHNGTRVNGQLVSRRCDLSSDDVIGIGAAKLILHRPAGRTRKPILDAAPLRERLQQEVERALRYERPLSLVSRLLEPAARAGTLAALRSVMRSIDVAGWIDDRLLIVIVPELSGHAARTHAGQIAASLGGTLGLAHCPADGCRADALIAAARAAAGASGPGVHEASELVTVFDFDGSAALVADPAMIHLFEMLRLLAKSDLAVLLSGETGAGKENAARALHHWSPRAKNPFVAINCASLPEELVESELFGHERGAFSGAVRAKEGRLESAAGGTVFLDEVGELSPAAQAKLLRALEARRAVRVGGLEEYELDIRVLAATNRDLQAEVQAGRFRMDLFYRLSGAKLTLPPLRDRPRELGLLARRFLDAACAKSGRAAPALSAATWRRLQAHSWPGNIRELKNEMEYVAATTMDAVIEPWHLSERLAMAAPAAEEPAAQAADAVPRRFRPLADEVTELEKRRMREALLAAGGVQAHAAHLIGMPMRTFTFKYRQYGLGVKRMT